MPRRRQTRARQAIKRGQDKDGTYQAACRKLAAEIDWDPGAVCFVWSMLVEMRTKHNREPQAVAEYLAMRNTREALNCRGRVGS